MLSLPVTSVIAIMLFPLFFLYSCSTSPDPVQQKIVCKRLLDSIVPIETPEIQQLSETEFEAVAQERSCIKSYLGPAIDSFPSMTSNQMKNIRDHTNTLIQEYVRDPAPLFNKVASNKLPLEDILVVYHLTKGKNLDLFRLYGDLLYLKLLLKEQNFAEAHSRVQELRRTYNLTVAPSILDTGDEHTYFSKQTLHNLILLQGYSAQAQLKPEDFVSGSHILENFLKDRPSFASVFVFQEDPSEKMFSNIGCPLD
jgi:hypothetical protein